MGAFGYRDSSCPEEMQPCCQFFCFPIRAGLDSQSHHELWAVLDVVEFCLPQRLSCSPLVRTK